MKTLNTAVIISLLTILITTVAPVAPLVAFVVVLINHLYPVQHTVQVLRQDGSIQDVPVEIARALEEVTGIVLNLKEDIKKAEERLDKDADKLTENVSEYQRLADEQIAETARIAEALERIQQVEKDFAEDIAKDIANRDEQIKKWGFDPKDFK